MAKPVLPFDLSKPPPNFKPKDYKSDWPSLSPDRQENAWGLYFSDKNYVSTLHNTVHDAPAGLQERVRPDVEAAFTDFIVRVVKAASPSDLAPAHRELLMRTLLADLAGCMYPLARMLNCTDTEQQLRDGLQELFREAW